MTEDEGATVGIREGWNVKKCRPVVKGPSGGTLLATKDNPRLCRGEKTAYGEGQSRQEKVSELE